MNYIFKVEDIKRMIEHWLATKPNGYIGVSYGRELQQLLLKPMTEDSADTLLRWMKADIPILKQLSDSDLMVVSEDLTFEKKRFFIQIGTILIKIPTQADENILGD